MPAREKRVEERLFCGAASLGALVVMYFDKFRSVKQQDRLLKVSFFSFCMICT